MWWEWMIFAIVLVIVPFGVNGLKKLAFSEITPTKEQERYARKKAVLYTAFFWLCDLFGMSFIIDNIACRFAFGIMVMICIFANLAVQPVVGAKGFLLKLGLIGDFLCGVGFSIYLIYIIPNKDLRTVVLAIVAAVYGGMMTLVGVAWTIKKGDKDRKDDMQRIEQERQEEERRKYRPVFSVVGKNADPQKRISIDLSTVENINKITTNKKNKNNIELYPVLIENSSKIEFYVYGFLFDGIFYATQEKYLIKKDYCIFVYLFDDLSFTCEHKMAICLEDLIENKYEAELNGIVEKKTLYIRGNKKLQLMGAENE